LKIEDIQAIEKIELENGTSLWHSKNYFLFSYYTMGTNFVDIANLKWNDLEGERMNYTRTKTHKNLNISLNPKAQAIVELYRKLKHDEYVFPIYYSDRHITPQQKKNREHKALKATNNDLKIIGEKCEISVPLTTYVARHSAATILKRIGVSTTQISELMGHQTEEITQTYLDSFENKVLDSVVNLL